MNDVWDVTPCSLAQLYHDRGKGQASGAPKPVTNRTGALRRYWDNQKYYASKLKVFLCEITSLKIIRRLGTLPQKVRQPYPRPKKFKQYRF
jgi:hypothetical protein